MPIEDHGFAPTKVLLLRAAEQRFAASGVQGSRLADIAADASFTTGAFYRYFDKKLDVIWALFDQMDAELETALSSATHFGESASRMINVLRAHPGTVRSTIESTRSGTPFADAHRRARSSWADHLAGRIADQLHVDPVRAHLAALASVDVLTHRVHAEVLGMVPRRTPEELVGTLEHLFCRGLYG